MSAGIKDHQTQLDLDFEEKELNLYSCPYPQKIQVMWLVSISYTDGYFLFC